MVEERSVFAAEGRSKMTYQVKPVFQLGYYKHYKGTVYQIRTIASKLSGRRFFPKRCAQDSETLEWLIVYGNVHGDWVRTADNFLDLINHEGKTVPRFEFIGEEKP